MSKYYLSIFILFLGCLSFLSVDAQTIVMSNGSSNTCSATFVDSGGAGANYSDNESFEYTVCPDLPGSCLWVDFSSFQTQLQTSPFGNNSDILNVFDGSSVTDPLIQILSGDLNDFDFPVASSSGCLTFQFLSTSGGNEPGWSAEISCMPCPEPGIVQHQDCIGAIPVCSDRYFQPNSYTGEGTIMGEINQGNSCLANEDQNTQWFIFNIHGDGAFRFMIHPLIPENYNWALYDLTNAQCPETFIIGGDAPVVSCNNSDSQNLFGTLQDRGITGANSLAPFNGFGNSNTGSNEYINQDVMVTEGQILLLAITSGNANQGGFFIDLSDSDPIIIDNQVPTLREVLLPTQCGEDEITIVFNEHLDCNTVDASDFILTGPGGPYTILDVLSEACTTVPQTDYHEKFFRLQISPPVNVAGTFHLIMNGTLLDNCGNAMPSFDSTFVIDLLAADAGADLNLCLNDPGSITLGGMPANPLGGTAIWTANSSPALSFLSDVNAFNPSLTISNLPEGNYTYFLEIDDGDCLAYDTVSVNVVDCSCDLVVDLMTQDLNCFGDSNGSIQSTVSGGTMPYTYTWTNGIGNEANPGNLIAGTYDLTVTSSEGCIGESTISIFEPSALIVSTGFTSPTCGLNNGSFEVSSTLGGTSPYTYDFGSGQGTNSSLDNIGPGMYSVSITDNNGCEEIRTVDLVDIPGASVITDQLGNTSDCGACDGFINISVSQGSIPYTYSWENTAFPGVIVSNNEDLAGLCAGTYCLSLTDANQCETVFCETVVEPGGPQVTVGTITPASCELNNGSAQLIVTGGTGLYEFNYQNTTLGGAPILNTNPANNLAAGTYSITVTNNDNTCPFVVGLTVPEVSSPVIDQLDAIGATCGASNGTASALVSGGSGTYLYNWENQNNPGTSVSSTNPALNLLAGTYDLTVSNDDGTCPVTGSVNVPDLNDLSLSFSSIPENCEDESGSATVSVSGGSGSYTYLWNDPGMQTNAIATGLSAGNYEVTVSDNQGGAICSIVGMVDVFGDALPVVDSIVLNPEFCGASDGQVAVAASGLTSPLNYSWISITDPNLVLPSDSLITGIPAGSYQLTISNNNDNGCSIDTLINIASIGGPSIDNSIITPENCSGVDGLISLQVSGGMAPYTFTWEDPLNPTAPLSNSPDLLGLASGTYLVTVVNSDGSCPVAASFDVPGTEAPVIDSFQVVNDDCSSMSGSINLSVSSSASMLSYVWSLDGQADTLGTTNPFTGLSSGSYSVTVSNTDGSCPVIETGIQLGGTPAPQIDSFFIDAEHCNIGDGRIGLSVSGGIPPYTFDWEDLSDPGAFLGIGDTISFLSTGDYAVSIYNVDSSCITLDTFFVPFIDEPMLVDIQTTLQSCDDEDGTISISVTGGLAPYQFNWVSVDNPGGSVGNDSIVTGLAAGTYQYQVENADGSCDIVGLVDVGLAPSPVLQNILSTNITCVGNDGTLFALVSGGLGNLQFNWEREDTPGVLVGNTSLITGLTPGTYALTVSNEDGSCSVFGSASLGGVPGLVLGLNSSDITCFGFNDGTASVSASNGNPPFQYLWDTGETTQGIQNLNPGAHSVTVSNNQGCIGIVGFNILEPTPLAVQTTSSQAVSCTGGDDGSASAQAIGGTAPYTYQWNGATGGQTGPTASGLSAGVYSFIVIDANGCTAQGGNVVVSEPNDPLVGSLSFTEISCFDSADGSLTVSASGGIPDYQYQWSTGDVDTTIINLPEGNYTVTITDNNACELVLTQTLIAPPPIEIELTQVPTICFGESNGSLAATVTSGGVEPFVYSINGGAFGTDSLFVGLPSGRYEVGVMDADACLAEGDIFVEEPFELIVDLGPDETILLGDSISLIPQVNTFEPLAYSWTSMSSISCLNCPEPFVRPFDDAIYELIITDSAGCTASDVIEVFVNKDRNVFVPNAFTPNGDGVNDVFMVFGNSTVVSLQNFVIYNRWGEMMYSENQINANDPFVGWDGTLNGTEMNPGVFVYYFEVVYVDGEVQPFKGDVTLVR